MTKDSLRIYQELKNEIVVRKYLPGHKLSENEISERYHLSRTPVRDILKALEQDGLIQIESRSGTYVTPIVLSHLHDRRFIRSSVEYQVLLSLFGKRDSEDFLYLERVLLDRKKRADRKNEGDSLLFANDFFSLDNSFHAYLFSKAGKSSVLENLNRNHPCFLRYRFLTFLRDNYELEGFYENHKAIYDILKNKDRDNLLSVVHAHNYSGRTGLDKVKKEHPDYFID